MRGNVEPATTLAATNSAGLRRPGSATDWCCSYQVGFGFPNAANALMVEPRLPENRSSGTRQGLLDAPPPDTGFRVVGSTQPVIRPIGHFSQAQSPIQGTFSPGARQNQATRQRFVRSLPVFHDRRVLMGRFVGGPPVCGEWAARHVRTVSSSSCQPGVKALKRVTGGLTATGHFRRCGQKWFTARLRWHASLPR